MSLSLLHNEQSAGTGFAAAAPGLWVSRLQRDGLGPLSFHLARGETVCLQGPSGSGKSLLLRALADLDPHAGCVILDGVEQAALDPVCWRRKVGLLPAESAWWCERVQPHFSHPERLQGLEALGFDNAILTRRVEQLSSGERQRLALLRLLNAGPEVLLLDEPTAHLDADATHRVETLVRQYQQRHAAPVLWVSHSRSQQQRVASRILHLKAGRLEP